MQIAQDRYGWDRPTVLKALANRFAVHLNTVHGWVSIAEDGEASKRAQPAWQVIEILRFELGVTAPNGLDAFLNSPAVAE